MKRIDIDKAIADMMSAAGPDGSWLAWHNGPGSRPVVLEFPAGELFAKCLEGLLWGWKMLGAIDTGLPVDDTDKFSAQGLEGKCRVRCCLVTALLAARELPPFRRAIYEEAKNG